MSYESGWHDPREAVELLAQRQTGVELGFWEMFKLHDPQAVLHMREPWFYLYEPIEGSL